jgi:hypothetical protein
VFLNHNLNHSVFKSQFKSQCSKYSNKIQFSDTHKLVLPKSQNNKGSRNDVQRFLVPFCYPKTVKKHETDHQLVANRNSPTVDLKKQCCTNVAPQIEYIYAYIHACKHTCTHTDNNGIFFPHHACMKWRVYMQEVMCMHA